MNKQQQQYDPCHGSVRYTTIAVILFVLWLPTDGYMFRPPRLGLITPTLTTLRLQPLEDDVLQSRLPTSVDDQVRQAADALRRATADGGSSYRRHVIRLLLPVIGATELDDWPGGARQQMEAANPLVLDILRRWQATDKANFKAQATIIDESDGVAAILVQAANAKDDSCTVLLPTAETLSSTVQPILERQVGPNRNLILVNPQYRRKADFGGNTIFGFASKNERQQAIDYAEAFVPTFFLTNFICEGESIRVLRSHPGPWRVFLQTTDDILGAINWIQIGSKDFIATKPLDWDKRPENQRDGGSLYNYGQPSYNDIIHMITNSPNYKVKNPAERAAAAFNFIKDSL